MIISFSMKLFIDQSAGFLIALMTGLMLSLGLLHGSATASIMIPAALALFFLATLKEGKIVWPERPLVLLILGFLLLAMCLLPFSYHPPIAKMGLIQIASVLLPFMLLQSAAIHRLAHGDPMIKYLPWFLAAGLVVLLYFHFVFDRDFHPIFWPIFHVRFDKGLSFLALYLWPLLAYLVIQGHGARAKLCFFLATLLIFLSGSEAGKLAFIVAIAVFCLSSSFMADKMKSLLSGLALLIFIAAIGWTVFASSLFITDLECIRHLPPSWQARFEIWDYSFYRILERPFTGWGANTSWLLPIAEPHGDLYQKVKSAAAHPHNGAVQLWLEFGLGGLLIGLGFAFWLMKSIAAMSAAVKPYALASFVASLALIFLSYDLFSDAPLAAMAFAAFLFGRVGEQQRLGNLP
jgi:O-antigen ligase